MTTSKGTTTLQIWTHKSSSSKSLVLAMEDVIKTDEFFDQQRKDLP